MKLYKNKEWLEKQYCELMNPVINIAENCGSTKDVIYKWVQRFDLKRERVVSFRPRKYSLNETFFKNINNENKAYWLGFIAADGGIRDRKGSRALAIELSIKDEKHLLKLKKNIGYSGPLYYKKARNSGGPSVMLQLASKKMVLDLAEYGIVENKTLTLNPPTNLRENLIRHWIRGMFDGDGSVSYNKDGYSRGQFFGTKSVIKFIVKNIPSTKTVSKKKNCQGYYHSFTATQKLYYYLYNNASTYLERKKMKFKMFKTSRKDG